VGIVNGWMDGFCIQFAADISGLVCAPQALRFKTFLTIIADGMLACCLLVQTMPDLLSQLFSPVLAVFVLFLTGLFTGHLCRMYKVS